MAKISDRKLVRSFSPATIAALKDNTVGGSKAEAPKAEAPKAEAPKAEAPKAEAPKAERARPASAVLPARTQHLKKQDDNRVNVSLSLQIDDEKLLNQAAEIAEAAGVNLNTVLSGYVKAAILELQSRLKSDDLGLAKIGEQSSGAAPYVRSLMLRKSEIARITEAIDPFGLFSRTRVISYAVSQLMAVDKRV